MKRKTAVVVATAISIGALLMLVFISASGMNLIDDDYAYTVCLSVPACIAALAGFLMHFNQPLRERLRTAGYSVLWFAISATILILLVAGYFYAFVSYN